MTDEQLQVWQLIRESNRAWTAGAAHEVAALHDENAVLVTPDLDRVQGRDAIARWYQDSIHHAHTESFEEREHCIDVLGDLAFATYRFALRTTPAGEDEPRDETGQEVLGLRRGADGWKVIWRTQIST